jgi:tetratricopeptide (TPR) repeat protein
MAGLVSRREVARIGLLALPFLSWAGEGQASSVSRRVRLKDVENPKLQEALRAAVVGDLENAENLFSELLVEDPNSASVWSNRGSVRVSLQKFELAAEDFSKAIALAPEAPVPFLNRAISYEAMGRYDEAITDCKAAIVNDPEEYAAWFNLGNVLTRVTDYDAALKAYARASALAPGIAGYRLKEALVLFQLDRLDECRKLVQGLVRKYPNYAEAHAVLAAVLWKEGNRAQAEGQFEEATVREPRYQDIRWVAGELQWPPGIIKAMSKFLNITY